MNVKYLIIGAGPAGLALGVSLLAAGEKDFVILEENAFPGGLCKSKPLAGSPIDVGGGHILDVKNQEACELIFRYLPKEEWNRFDRITKIRVGEYEIDYPFEANIWQLPEGERALYLKSIEEAGCLKGEPMPERFVDWIAWKLGDRIAEKYMLPYNEKIFSCDLNTLGTYWLSKLPDVSYEETVKSYEEQKPFGKVPAHASFYYPKAHGYGEAFARMADELGSRLILGERVRSLCPEMLMANGNIRASRAIINTAPWHAFPKQFPVQVQEAITKLEYTGVDVDYQGDAMATDAHWTYFADPALSYHRIIHRNNIQPGAKGCWTETNSKRRLPGASGPLHFENPYAYPLNTLAKPAAIQTVLDYGKSMNIIGLGRWGEWEHYNSDVVISRAIALSKELLG